METRKVQQLGPSTLAVTLPAEWAREQGVAKGDEITLRPGGNGALTVSPTESTDVGLDATVHADALDADALERAVLAQYVLGRRVINVVSDDTLDSAHINAVYEAERQLMGLGVVEETPDRITVRCSVDPEDFNLDNLLQRLENTGRTTRGEAVKALTYGDADLAQRALNRERQANKIFVLLLRLIFTAYEDPRIARAVGLKSGFPLLGYRSVAKNLELIADNAEDIAEIAMDADGHTLDVDDPTIRQIQELTDSVDEITALAVKAAVERDYADTVEVRSLFRDLQTRKTDILADLPEMDNESLLQVREVLVSLDSTAQHAMRIAEIAANLSVNQENEYVSLD